MTVAYAEELRGKYIDEIETGMSAVYSKTVTEADIILFAGISGDTNPVHLDEDFANRDRRAKALRGQGGRGHVNRHVAVCLLSRA